MFLDTTEGEVAMGVFRQAIVTLMAVALGVGAQAPGATAGSGVGTPTDPVIVATAPAGKKAFFADMVRLHDGRLLVAYRDSVAHINQDGRILVVESSDDGRTWSSPRVAVDTSIDDRDPKLMQTRDGTVLMNFFRTDWTGYPANPATLRGTYVTRSDDNGATWGEPVKVGTAMDGPSNVVVGAYYAGHAATHGPIVELADGDLLVPLYGRLPEGGRGPASVVRSTDGGLSWPKANESFIGVSDSFDFQEPNLSVLRDGTLMSIVRTSINIAYVSWSHDDGTTWTTPETTTLPASSHHQLMLRNGDMLLTYGDLSGQFGAGRPTAGRILMHPENGIEAKKDILVYDAAIHGPPTTDQANPSSVELSPGRYFTITSDPHIGSIVGIYTRNVDYLDQ
ncbi:glycoside hydrolase [Micromonospora sp. DR5-3]|uniref:sialidase family protein n=1 Tax=unclassified Micromonospora TaxID=2617518 RepID=UPI0011D8D4EA|nr:MULTISPECIES: sialidase family protein [unclassified Micromonospora]MCW3818917.1 glycoside hydrolase [Micromonospora sp. DR5-3]TYC20941.1 exo-alpha-sialidase [Micromonospora sp. MP36]